MECVDKIMQVMDTIEYGFKNNEGINIYNLGDQEWDKFYDFYYLLSPSELLERRCGVCWDQVELERKLFNDAGIKVKTFFIFIEDNENLPSHTFLTFEAEGKHYWFEHSWDDYKGIHEYETIEMLLKDVKEKFIKYNLNITRSSNIYLFEYNVPPIHIGCNDFYKFIETQKEIKFE